MPPANAEPPPLILMASPTGARRTKRDHPALPMTAEEIAAEALACAEAGACAIHVHVRDRDGLHSLAPELYRAAFAAIERRVGRGRLLLQATSEAAGRFQPAEQMAAMRALRPEAVSLAVRELAPDAASEPAAAEFFAWMETEKVGAQYIVYSADELRRFNDLRRRGLIPGERPSLIYVFGQYSSGQAGQPGDVLAFLDAARENVEPAALPWMVCAFGPREGACALTAAGLGGHVRVGFENNLHLADGRLAPGTAALVAQAAGAAPLLGRRVAADADAAREILAPR